MDDVAQLIIMNGKSLGDLPSGQKYILPEGPEVPSTINQIAAHAGPVPAAAPTAPATVAGEEQKRLAEQKDKLATGQPGLNVTATGSVNPPGATFPTLGSLFTPPFTPPPVTVQPAIVNAHPATQVTLHVDATDDQSDGSGFEEEDEAPFLGEMEEEPVYVAPVQMPTVVVAAGQAPPPNPIDRITAFTPSPVPAVAPAGPKQFAGDEELTAVEKIIGDINGHVEKVAYELGLRLLANPSAGDPKNAIHAAIYNVRWNSEKLSQMDPHALLSMEAVLTAHQVYVQGQENQWQGTFELLGRELERLIIMKRENYKGAGGTKAEMENAVIATEPRMRDLRNRYLVAQAMAMLLRGMGERFAQLEDGIKRTITHVVNEFERSHIKGNVIRQ